MNDYKKEKEMRQKLESNISEIVLNFQRLYEEAETARLIVTHKLKQLQTREKQLLAAVKQAELEANNREKEEKNVSDSNSMKIGALENRIRKQAVQQPRNIAVPA